MEHYTRDDIEILLTRLWSRPATKDEVDLVYNGYELGVSMSELIRGE